VIAIDQDSAGKQGRRVSQAGEQEIWTRELAGGARAVALFNRGAAAAPMTARWAALGLTEPIGHVRDLWTRQDVAPAAEYTVTVPAHGVVLLRVSR
jgi:alpha-galactosidase